MYGSTSLRPEKNRIPQRNGRQNASPTTASNYITVGEGSPLPKKRNFCQIKRSIRELPLRIGGVFFYFAQRASTSSTTIVVPLPHRGRLVERTVEFVISRKRYAKLYFSFFGFPKIANRRVQRHGFGKQFLLELFAAFRKFHFSLTKDLLSFLYYIFPLA